jgi:hypothetical protein
MAEQEGKKYFVYIVVGLTGGNNPRLFIIQDPVQWLTPDPPTTMDYSGWKNGVIEEVHFSSIEGIE